MVNSKNSFFNGCPSTGARLEDRLYEHLEWSAPPRPRAHELLGEEMVQAGLEVGSTTPYGECEFSWWIYVCRRLTASVVIMGSCCGSGTALMRCGGTQKQLGETERKFVQSVNIHFLTPLRCFTEGEYRAIQVKGPHPLCSQRCGRPSSSPVFRKCINTIQTKPCFT